MSREQYPNTGRDVPYPPDDPDTERPDHPLPTPPPNPNPPPPFPVPPAVPHGPAEKGVVIDEPAEKGVIVTTDVAAQAQQEEEAEEDTGGIADLGFGTGAASAAVAPKGVIAGGPAEKGVVVDEPGGRLAAGSDADVSAQEEGEEEEDTGGIAEFGFGTGAGHDDLEQDNVAYRTDADIDHVVGADPEAVYALTEPLNAEPEHAVTDTEPETAEPGFTQEIVTMNGVTSMNGITEMNGFTPEIVEENDGADPFARDEFHGDIAASG